MGISPDTRKMPKITTGKMPDTRKTLKITTGIGGNTRKTAFFTTGKISYAGVIAIYISNILYK